MTQNMDTLAYIKGARVRRLPVGFSWTTLLFGMVPSMIRNHWSFAWFSMALSLLGMFVSIFVFKGLDMFLSVLTFRILAAAMRNAHLNRHAVKDGWILKDAATVHPFAAND